MSETMQSGSDEDERVADGLPDSFVYRLYPRWVWPYAQLARWDRPIGWWLLLWPCWWSVALAFGYANGEDGWPAIWHFSLAMTVICLGFLWGAVAMRGAGCTYNDIVDRKLDARVARTVSRPIPSGRVSVRGAVWFILFQAAEGLIALILLCFVVGLFNWFAFWLAVASLAIVALYPFAKRVTDWPQLVLGFAFSWGALMGWAVLRWELSAAPLLLYAGSILWVIGYDTIYAHQDREDDALIGVRSTARLFGEHTKGALAILYAGALLLFSAAYMFAGAGWPAYAGLIAGAIQMGWQLSALDIDDADKCLRLFKSNGTFGWILFGGLVADLFF